MATILGRIRNEDDVLSQLQNAAAECCCAVSELRDKMLKGEVVALKSATGDLTAVGSISPVRVNANIGTGGPYSSIADEMEKLNKAEEAGADTVMDLSTGGDVKGVRKAVLNNTKLPLGTVPVYEAALRAQKRSGSVVEMDPEELFEVIEAHCDEGVSFLTVHCGITIRAIEALKSKKRIMGIVSRGGAFTVGWIERNGRENPLYEEFDRLVSIASRYDVTLSLGDGMRPGAVSDAGDPAQMEELVILGELAEKCRKSEVQCMIEGPGHMPLNLIESQIKTAKTLTGNAPLYVLGPLITDAALGYDHIAAAIGGAVAGLAGADFLCYVTPREHIGLPTADDVYNGVAVTKIAAHAADIARGRSFALRRDNELSKARAELDWEKQIEMALDPRVAETMLKERNSKLEGPCTMCGDLCAVKLTNEILNKCSG